MSAQTTSQTGFKQKKRKQKWTHLWPKSQLLSFHGLQADNQQLKPGNSNLAMNNNKNTTSELSFANAGLLGVEVS